MTMQMIRTLMLLCWIMGGSYAVAAQTNPVVEVEKTMAAGSRPAFRVDFKNASAERVLKLWREFAKSRFDAKLKKNKKAIEWVAYGLSGGSISTETFDMYSIVESMGKDVSVLYVWFDLGNYFLNQRDNPDRAHNAKQILTEFYETVLREVIADELKAEENKQKELEKKLKRLEKDKESLLKSIEDYKAKIKKAEADIVNNEQDQTKTQTEIEQQRKRVESVRQRWENVGRDN